MGPHTVAGACRILGIQKLPSSQKELKKTFLNLAKQHHPDKVQSTAATPTRYIQPSATKSNKMVELNIAYKTLTKVIENSSAAQRHGTSNPEDSQHTRNSSPDFNLQGYYAPEQQYGADVRMPWNKKTQPKPSRTPQRLFSGILSQFASIDNGNTNTSYFYSSFNNSTSTRDVNPSPPADASMRHPDFADEAVMNGAAGYKTRRPSKSEVRPPPRENSMSIGRKIHHLLTRQDLKHGMLWTEIGRGMIRAIRAGGRYIQRATYRTARDIRYIFLGY